MCVPSSGWICVSTLRLIVEVRWSQTYECVVPCKSSEKGWKGWYLLDSDIEDTNIFLSDVWHIHLNPIYGYLLLPLVPITRVYGNRIGYSPLSQWKLAKKVFRAFATCIYDLTARCLLYAASHLGAVYIHHHTHTSDMHEHCPSFSTIHCHWTCVKCEANK